MVKRYLGKNEKISSMSTPYINCSRCEVELTEEEAIAYHREDFNEELLREKIDAPIDENPSQVNRPDQMKKETPKPTERIYLCFDCNEKLQGQTKAGSKFT